MWEKKNKGTTDCEKSIVTCDVGTAQFEDSIIKYEKKYTWTTECGKSTVKCDVSTTQYDNGTIKCEKKIREPPNVTKVQLHVMLVMPNVTMALSNVWKKN